MLLITAGGVQLIGCDLLIPGVQHFGLITGPLV